MPCGQTYDMKTRTFISIIVFICSNDALMWEGFEEWKCKIGLKIINK
jgi:hypothetical protein